MMAGAASGVFNTTRQVGTVIGTAGVGALLQNRLAAGFINQVQQRAGHLPAAASDKMISGFQAAAKGGLEVGSGAAGQRAGRCDLHARLRPGDAADHAGADRVPGRGGRQLPVHQTAAGDRHRLAPRAEVGEPTRHSRG